MSSSSEFLRTYRIGVLAGANATYANDPKKAGRSFSTTAELLESFSQVGIIQDLSAIAVTNSTCPFVPPPSILPPPPPLPPPTPLVYDSTNYILSSSFASQQGVQGGIAYINDNSLYMVSENNPTILTYSLNTPNASIISRDVNNVRFPIAILQSVLDGYVYVLNANGTIARTGTGNNFNAGEATFLEDPGLINPVGFTQDYDTGNFYEVGQSGDINLIPPTGGSASLFTTIMNDSFNGIAYGNGALYVTSNGTGNIYKVIINTRTVTILVPGIFANTILFANDQNLYVATSLLVEAIYSITQDGIVTLFLNQATNPTDAITQAADESFYVHQSNGPGTIKQIVVS